ncbi:MAG: outer membrane beta-barrel protein [Lentimonas sp.]
MNINNTFLPPAICMLAGAFLLPSAVLASPLVSVGDEVDVYFNGSSSLRWTSNVFRDEEDEVSDLIWTLSPGFDINVGRGLSNADLSIITRYDIIRYQDSKPFDTETFHIRAVGSYQSSRLDLNGSVSFDEHETSTSDESQINSLIESSSVGARLEGEYRVSPKFSFGAGIVYDEREYTNDGEYYENNFADRETVRLPFDVYYELTPKVDLSLGYTYNQSDVGDTDYVVSDGSPVSTARTGYEVESHFFNIGARGQLLPKLNGFFKIGYRFRENDGYTTQPFFNGAGGPIQTVNSRSTGQLGLDANFRWSATPKVSANLDLSRDFGVGGEGTDVEVSSIGVSGNYLINTYWSALANAGYKLREYETSGREDNQYQLGARLTYSPNKYWSFGGGYNYIENDSNGVNRSYTNHVLDVSASLRY